MTRAERDQAQFIERFAMRGTVFERLIQAPEGWVHPQRFNDSPPLQRFVSDLYDALKREGWRPTTK